MPKKNNAGCGGGSSCCCGPVTERVDEFDNTWPCFVGLPNGFSPVAPGQSTFYQPMNGTWPVSGGQLIYSRTAGVINDDPISIDAVHLPVPYSMETIVEIAEMNTVSGDRPLLYVSMLATTTNPAGGMLGGIVQIGPNIFPTARMLLDGASGLSTSYTNPYLSGFTGPNEFWYKVQIDTDGIQQWLWIDGVKPTGTWGVKRSGTPSSLATNYKRYWNFTIRPTPNANRLNWVKFNRFEVREWDHTQITMPDPDNP